MTGDDTYTYGYNAESEIKSAAGVNYTYDGDGNRLEKSSGKIYWYGAGTEILDESDGSGNFTNEYVFFGGKRIAMRTVSTGTIYYYEEDMLGSSRTMVQAGQTSPCFDADFLPFGYEKDVTTTCTQNYKFEGKERDTETNNDDFGARYYTFRLGRWLSADWSAVPAPVPYANLTNPQTLNLYAMVSDNPESFADLDGHCSEPNESGCVLAADQPQPAPTNGEHNPTATACDKAGPGTCGGTVDQSQSQAQQNQQKEDGAQVGKTTLGSLEKTMSNEDRSLSTPKNGDPAELEKGKTALANAIINNAELDHPAKVAPATGTATTQDAQIMRTAHTNRTNGGADPVQGRTQYGTSHNGHLHSRSASNGLKGKAGKETVFQKFGPFKDSTSRRSTYIYIYNDPGH